MLCWECPASSSAAAWLTRAACQSLLPRNRHPCIHWFPPTSPFLSRCRLESICLQRWGRMDDQLRQCYKGVELRPPLEELRRMFAAAKRAQ